MFIKMVHDYQLFNTDGQVIANLVQGCKYEATKVDDMYHIKQNETTVKCVAVIPCSMAEETLMSKIERFFIRWGMVCDTKYYNL